MTSRWPKNEGGGRPDARSYPPPRAPSGRPHFRQDERSDLLGRNRDGSPGGREDGMGSRGFGGPGRPGGGGIGPGSGGMQGHRLKESDFPLEMGGGAPRSGEDKTPPLRPRGTPWSVCLSGCLVLSACVGVDNCSTKSVV